MYVIEKGGVTVFRASTLQECIDSRKRGYVYHLAPRYKEFVAVI